MAEMDWVYYDTKDVSTTGNTDISFFANTEGAQLIHITNLGSANELPTNEKFEVQEIHVMATPDIEVNDVYELFEEAMIEVKINNNRKLIVPALLCGSNARAYLMTEDQADAATDSFMSPAGGPFKLDIPIIIPGGVKFEVIFRTGTTAAGNGDAIIIALRGKLTRT